MTTPQVGERAHRDLVDVIRQVRKRWRMRLLLRGGIIVVIGALVALMLASAGLQTYKFSPASITIFRVVTLAVFAALVALWLIRPLRRRVTDMQVALYVEEHEPSLQAAILSAVDVGGAGGVAPSHVPPAILDRLIAQAVEKCSAIDGGRVVARSAIRRYALVLGTAVAAAALLLVVGPEFFRQGASALLILSRSAEAASPYAIRVTPGDATVPKGSDQTVTAKLAGFRASAVVVRAKADGDAEFQAVPLVTGDGVTYEGMLFSVKRPVQYYVEADGVRSPTYTMNVVELPAVENLELEYIYPAYTGLPPQKVPSGGDIAAIRGTEVRVRVKPTMSTGGGALDLEPGAAASLTPDTDGTLTGSFTIADSGFYHVELDGPHGEHVTASPKYTIDALADQPPTVTFEKPKRDVQASPIEEVPLQARADDDYGVKSLQLVYSVDGGPEKTIDLYKQGGKALTSVSVGHTVYLEEMNVKPGDFVQYYAQAADDDTVKGPQVVKSDVYFIEVRPFNQDFHQATSQAGGGGGGGGGNQDQPGAFSEQERQIMAATFNVDRDRAKLPADKVKENTKFVALSQSKLRGQVDDLVGQMQQRLGGGGDENFQKIAELLPKASAEMKKAEGSLAGQQTHEALSPEGKALQYLQQAEQLYEIEVRQGGGGGGGGGGGQQQMASELADLFQLQRDRAANQYETEQHASDQNAAQQVDALAEKLRELAQRQLDQEKQQQAHAGQQAQGGSGGASQRALADEVEQAARQLEQLQREEERQGQSRQDLADAARRLEDSASAMRQAAASNADGGASAAKALQQLQEAQRLLQQNQNARAGQNARDALDKANQLVDQQKQIAAGVQQAGRTPAGPARDSALSQLGDQKDHLASGVGDLEQELNALGDQALANGQRDEARKLEQAAGTIRGQHMQDLIDYSKQAMGTPGANTGQIEGAISSNLDAIRQQVADAAAAAGKADQSQGLGKAAQQAADMVRNMATLNDQLNQALGPQGQNGQGQQARLQQQGAQGTQGQQPGQGSQGQQGQRGQQPGQGQAEQAQSAQGQRGQGQQGQGQQGQGMQGQQGQQGQGQQGQNGQGQQGQGGQGQQGQSGQGQQAQRGEGQGQGQAQGQGGGRQGQGQPGQQRLGQAGNAPTGTGEGGEAAFTNGAVRQLQNQANQMATDAEALRRQLQASGGTRQDLQSVDDFIKALHELGNDHGNAETVASLSEAALDKIQRIEFELRKRTDTSNDQLFVSGGDDAPAKYRALVDQYYRELSKQSAAAAASQGSGQSLK